MFGPNPQLRTCGQRSRQVLQAHRSLPVVLELAIRFDEGVDPDNASEEFQIEMYYFIWQICPTGYGILYYCTVQYSTVYVSGVKSISQNGALRL